MVKLVKLVLVCTLLVCTACSKDDDNNSVSEKVLSGKVFGKSFVAKGGKAFTSGDEISIEITNVVADCKSDFFELDYSVSTYIKKEKGTNTKANVIFSKKGEIAPLNVLNSTVIVEEITDSLITIKIKSNSGSDNDVEGKFTVPFCSK